jgi:hypothetical protein
LRASGFYMIERYPFPGSAGIPEQDVRDCLTSAEGLIQRLKPSLS